MTALAAGFLDVATVVAGVILGLTGLAVGLMGLIAWTEGARKRGAYALLGGGVALAVGLWLVGALG